MYASSEVTSVEDSSILGLIIQQLDNFPELVNYVTKNNLTTGTLLTPQELMSLDKQLDVDAYFACETYSFMDMVSIYSLSVYGDSNYFRLKVIDSIINTRLVNDFTLTLGSKSFDQLTYKVADDPRLFLENNTSIVALYLVTLLNRLSFRG